MIDKPVNRITLFSAIGRSGTTADVDSLMSRLHAETDFTTTKLVDFALSQVETEEGAGHIRYYLFNGTQIQRNYAALYFKRRAEIGVLHQAVVQGKIDELQAFSE